MQDFASFLKKRSQIEDEHSKELKKLCRNTHEMLRRPEVKQGSYSIQFAEVTGLHERMAENGAQFQLSLHQMHEDLEGLALNMEKGRKHWKHTALAAEQRVSEAEKQMEKAKTKYDQLAEDYDGVKTGDKKVRGRFGIGGPKNEDDLQSRLQAADGDYAQKVQHAKSQRQELTSVSRPQAVKAIQELITECDSALTLQLQKFATFNEKLLLSNGLLITPLSDPNAPGKGGKSLRDIANQIDNQRDLHQYIRNHSSKVPSRPKEISYEQHPTQRSFQSQQPRPPSAGRQQPQLQSTQSFGVAQPPPQPPQLSVQNEQRPPSSDQFQSPAQNQTPTSRFPTDGYSQSSPSASQQQPPQQYQAYSGFQQQQPPPPQDRGYGAPLPQQFPDARPPQQQYPGPGMQGPPPAQFPMPGGPTFGTVAPGGPRPGSSARDQAMNSATTRGPPTKPSFGVTLEDLFNRDQTPVPKAVMDCIQAVDMFGLDVEGIYRVPGTNAHIQQLKHLFDTDADSIDFRNPEAFYHDVNSVAGLLKQFFRDLPEPLMTTEHYGRFIDAARMEDTTARRDNIHAAINELPDPNYATLRALVLHLWRVQQHEYKNRMSSMNLAICFA